MKRISLLIVLLLLIVGCTPLSHVPPAKNLSSATPPSSEESNSVNTGSMPGEPTSAILELCRSVGPRTPEMQQRFVDYVNEAVQESETPADIRSRVSAGLGPDSADVRQADVDGDGFADLLIAWAGCDLPVMVYRHGAPGQPVLLPSDYIGASPPGGNRIDRVADVNGDGQPELAGANVAPGGSADTITPYIWQWRDGRFITLFQAHLSNWRGPNRWEVGTGLVSIQCRPLGPFQHKLSPHRQLTEVYRWDQAARAYALADRTSDPITVQLQQVDVAERLFYAGQYQDALGAYQAVAQYPADKMDAVPWVPFSRWRIAEINALLGDRETALAALEQGAIEPQPLGDLATVFLNAYMQMDAASGFAAVWEYLQQAAGPDQWPYLFDKSSIAARPVLEDAFRRAGRPLTVVLPEAPKLDPADCMLSHS